ncbi:hypothetical protein D5018_16165 [Parashewanella curva]|uniref:Uncharacterized protein n=1 Tax=Parashewanella curva TaxID=2338552 RepID=A0A3L8PTN7_9GAMM|nr:hypothetical protein [Parashewanella curva]RLV58656.1 hypothetical protein D5018_16165 [Parashewanella curva]
MVDLESKRRWQVYILLLLVTTIARTVERLLTDTGGMISNSLPLLLALWVALGINACSNRNILFNQYVWRLTSWILLIAAAIGVVFGGYLLFSSGNINRSGLILVTYSLLLIPAFYKTWQYGYRSAAIWH